MKLGDTIEVRLPLAFNEWDSRDTFRMVTLRTEEMVQAARREDNREVLRLDDAL